MHITTALLPGMLQTIEETIAANAEEVTALDQAIGDGDHVYNLQRGLQALIQQAESLTQFDWPAALQKIGMTLMSTVGGASGSLYGTLFVTMSKAAKDKVVTVETMAESFAKGVESMKLRGRTELGEKTMLDVLIPVMNAWQQGAGTLAWTDLLKSVADAAVQGMESTRDMVAIKGRASFLGERSKGHLDAGARTAQLMICAIVELLAKQSATPA